MAIDITKFFSDLSTGASWAAGVSFQRSNPLPLDKYSVFENYDKALEYATTKAVAYPGQVIAALEDGAMTLYVINSTTVGEGDEAVTTMSLDKVGGADLDGKSLTLNAAGVAQLAGFEGAENNKLPMKVDGSIVWKSLEDIGAGDGNDDTTYQFALGEDGKSITVTTLFNGQAIEGDPQIIALDVYTKSEIDEVIGAASVPETSEGAGDGKAATGLHKKIEDETVRALAAEKALSDRITVITDGIDQEKVDSLNELIEWVDEHGGEVETIKQDIVDNAAAIETLNGDATTEGSVEHKIAAAITAENLEQYAKAENVYTKTEIDNKIGTPGTPAVKDSEGKTTTEAVAGTGIFANTYSKAELNALLDEIEGGSTESAASVKRQLDAYVSSNDDRVKAIEDEQDTQDTAIAAAQAQADKGVADAAAAQTKANEAAGAASTAQAAADAAQGTANTNAEAITALQGVDTTHGNEINALKGKVGDETAGLVHDVAALNTTVGGHTSTLATLAEKDTAHDEALAALNTTVGNHSTEIANLKSSVGNVYTKTEADGKFATGEALTEEANRAKAAEKANADAIAALYTAAKDETPASGILVDEIARVEGLVTAEKNRAEGVEANHEGRIAEMETFWAAVETPDETIDTLAEIVKYIESDESGAAAMAADIKANSDALAALEPRVKANEDKLVGIAGTVADAIAAAAPGLAGTTAGLAIANAVENGIEFAEGKGTVHSLNVNKLVQTKNTYLVLNGGNASLTWPEEIEA